MHSSRVVLLVACLLMLSPAEAHHEAYACIERDVTVTVIGLIEDVRYDDPHVVLSIRTDQSIVVTAEWRAPWELANRLGITRELLQRGDRIAVRASPYDCEPNRIALIVELRRIADGWSWSAR